MSDKLNLQPIADRAFVNYIEVVAPNEVGGILLPEGYEQNKAITIYVKVEVVAVGPDAKYIKAGMTVIVAKQRMEKIIFDDNTYWLIVEAAVVGIVP